MAVISTDIYWVSNRFREFELFKTIDRERFAVTLSYAKSCSRSFDDERADFFFDACISGWIKCAS
jgi:hypothetical protein